MIRITVSGQESLCPECQKGVRIPGVQGRRTSTMKRQFRRPFLFNLLRLGPDGQVHPSGQDLLFRRKRPEEAIGEWATFIDLEDPAPCDVLILVRTNIHGKHVNHAVNRAQNYLSRHLQKFEQEERDRSAED